MGLFDLIEKDHRIRFATHCLRELTTLIVTHIARRRTHQTAHRMTLLILAHVDACHHGLVIEKEFRQSLRQFGLSHTGSTHEQERTDRPLLVLKARTRATDRIRNRLYGRILTHYPLMQFRLHAQKFLPLALQHPVHRDTGPFRNNLRNILRSDGLSDYRILDRSLTGGKFIDTSLRLRHSTISDFGHPSVVTCPFGIMSLDLIVLHLLPLGLEFRQYAFLLLPSLTQRLPFLLKHSEFRLDLVHLQRHSLPADSLSFNLQLTDTAVQFRYRLRHRIHLQTELGSRLVHKVNRLVRQETVGDVAVRKFDSRNKGIILDTHLVVVLVALLQTSHDRYRSCRGRLIHHDHLEPSFEGLVSLEILLILVKSGRSYGTEFASCQGGFKDIGCIHGTRRASGTDQGVDFVNEEDDLSVAVHNLLDHSLEALLELSLILCSCNQRSQVERIYLPALEVLRHVSVHNLLGNALGNRRLAHSGLTYKYRIVLCPPAEDLQ